MAKKPVADKVARQHLTVYLCKQAITAAEQAIRPDSGAVAHVVTTPGVNATLYLRTETPKPPSWESFLRPGVPTLAPPENVSSAAVLVIQAPKSKRWFAFTFGYGRFLLRLEACESDFGLKVTINSVDPEQLRSIDVRTLEENSVHTRRQTSRDSPLEAFGVDPARDLLRGVTGRPRPERDLGSRLTGAASLALSLPVELQGLPELCGRLFPLMTLTDYKDRFGWIDEFAAVGGAEIEQLDLELVRRLNRARPAAYLAPPEALDWTAVSDFIFSVAPSVLYREVGLADYLQARNGSPTKLDVAALHAEELWAVSDTGDRLQSWTIYQSLLCEIDRAGQRFVLSGGIWYAVSADFGALVDSYVRQVKDAGHLAFPLFQHTDEAAYNVAARAALAANGLEVALLDHKTVKWTGNDTSIEFCDLMTSAGDLIHIKRETAATHISHLLNQGLVGGECFVQEPRCRDAVLKKVAALPTKHAALVRHFAQRPDPRQYKVVYGVIASGSDPLPASLSFFSKVTLMTTVRRLTALGYAVHMKRIGLTPAAQARRTAAKQERKAAKAKPAAPRTRAQPATRRGRNTTGRSAQASRPTASSKKNRSS